MAATDELVRFLDENDHENGVRLSELPEGFLKAKLLVLAAGNGLVEIGECRDEVSSVRRELVEVKRWHWRSNLADRNYKPLPEYLDELVADGWHARLTPQGRIAAADLQCAVDDGKPTGDEDDGHISASKLWNGRFQRYEDFKAFLDRHPN